MGTGVVAVLAGRTRTTCKSAREGGDALPNSFHEGEPSGRHPAYGLLSLRRMRGACGSLMLLVLVTGAALAQSIVPPPCSGSATLAIFVDNGSSESSVDITVDGEVAADAVPCS